MIDYAKEHGITTILNAILSNPKLKEKFEINFKEVSWNRFRYRYSVSRDGALESDISVIYTPKTFIPRAIKVNVTLHLYGMSLNFIDAQIRLEGLDEAAKAFIIDRLTSDNFVRKISEKPERLLDILKTLASKVILIFLSCILLKHQLTIFTQSSWNSTKKSHICQFH